MLNNCTTTPFGLKTIGSLCFPTVSTQSAFAPLTFASITVTNKQGTQVSPTRTSEGRAVIIGNQPLLEAWRGTNGQRMVTTYGKPNTGYEIRSRISVPGAAPWILRMTNLMPSTMSYSQPIPGIGSNAPVFFLQANER